MSYGLPQHLTDEQFSDLMAGEAPRDGVHQHLLACDHCRGELDAVQSSLKNFNALSLSWANRESVRRLGVPSRWLLFLGGRPSWGIGAAVTAIALLIFFGLNASPRQPPEPEVAHVGRVAPTPAELDEDNRMLASINEELSYNAQTAVPVAELQVSTTDAQTAAAAATVAN